VCTSDPVADLASALDSLDQQDLASLSDPALRQQLLALLAAGHRLHAQVARHVQAFDDRELAKADGCRSAKAWLRAFGRLSAHAASSLVNTARLLFELPHLAAAAASGTVGDEQLTRIVRLAERVGVDNVREVEPILTQAAATLDPADLQTVCDRVRVHLGDDGPAPDAHQDFTRRGITCSSFDGMLLVRGQLDAEGGATLQTALDAMTPPPAADDPRTAAQRRADALVELARAALSTGRHATVRSIQPQLGVLLTPLALVRGAGADATDAALSPGAPRQPLPTQPVPSPPVADCADPLAAAGVPPVPDSAWLDWMGPIPDAVAQRLACDCDVWRVVLDPATGLPLDVGRTRRVVPHWIRKALYARDRGCRFPGCHAPAPWTDAHHLDHWVLGGPTKVENLVLLCRFHHVLLHEGGWSIRLDQQAGTVSVRRPDGSPYEVPPSRPWTAPHRRAA
jgi:hypothetical protein